MTDTHIEFVQALSLLQENYTKVLAENNSQISIIGVMDREKQICVHVYSGLHELAAEFGEIIAVRKRGYSDCIYEKYFIHEGVRYFGIFERVEEL